MHQIPLSLQKSTLIIKTHYKQVGMLHLRLTSVLLYTPVAQLLSEHYVLWTLQQFFPCKPTD